MASAGEVKRGFVNATGAGNTEMVAAPGAGLKVQLLAAFAVATTAVSLKFQSATTDISAAFPLAANGGFVLPRLEDGWCETAQNAALNVNLSSGVATGVQFVYRIVKA